MSKWNQLTVRPWTIDRSEVLLVYRLQRLLPWRVTVFASRALSFIAEHSLAWIIISAVAAILDADRRAAWIAVLIGTLIAHASATVLKILVRRPRPDDSRLQVLGSTMSRLSFPSSHSAGTAAFATGVAFVVPALWWAAVLLVLAMALARLRLGVHYPSDVLVGVGIGVLCAAACQWAVAAI